MSDRAKVLNGSFAVASPEGQDFISTCKAGSPAVRFNKKALQEGLKGIECPEGMSAMGAISDAENTIEMRPNNQFYTLFVNGENVSGLLTSHEAQSILEIIKQD